MYIEVNRFLLYVELGQASAGGHRQRVNVLGALRQDRSLVWRLHEPRTTREDVIAFLDDFAKQPRSSLHCGA